MSRTAVGAAHGSIAAHGLRAGLPQRWEARLYLRDEPELNAAGELANPVLHLANFALPPGWGDFGAGAVERMGPAHAFVSLLEYDADEAGRPLFAARGIPRPALADFSANALQRRLPGQLGCQRFSTERGRAFCLYIVLGSRRHAAALLEEVNAVLDQLEVTAKEQVHEPEP